MAEDTAHGSHLSCHCLIRTGAKKDTKRKPTFYSNELRILQKNDRLHEPESRSTGPPFSFDTAWSPHYKKGKGLLDRIQRRFSRMIP